MSTKCKQKQGVIFAFACSFSGHGANCFYVLKIDEERRPAMQDIPEIKVNTLPNALIIQHVQHSEQSGERNERRSILFLCGAILLLASVLGINQAGLVYLPPFIEWGGPTLCVTKALFHRDCAGCGITRSLISIGHGDWRASLAFHPVGIAFYLFLWAQVLFQISALQRLKQGQTGHKNRFLLYYGYALIAAFLLTGVYRFWPR